MRIAALGTLVGLVLTFATAAPAAEVLEPGNNGVSTRTTCIRNEDGTQHCTTTRTLSMVLGSYLQSCEGVSLQGSVLQATCRTAAGNRMTSALDTNTCAPSSTVSNQNGHLTCDQVRTTQRTITLSPGLTNLLNGAVAQGQGNQPNPSPGGAPPQVASQSPPVDSGSWFPPGSWRQSCSDATFDGLSLKARCKRPDGTLVDTREAVTACAQPAEFANINGFLRCENGERHPVVGGAWALTCINERLSGNRLAATCRDNQNTMVSASLDVSTCLDLSSGLDNLNGRLVCTAGTKDVAASTQAANAQSLSTTAAATPAPSPSFAIPSPGGSWKDSCSVIKVTPDLRLEASCRRIDGSSVDTTILITDCAQPAAIGNSDGRLVCESGPRNLIVKGSWARLCINDRVIDTTVTASCAAGSNELQTTSLNLAECIDPDAGASDNNGRLVCVSGSHAELAKLKQAQKEPSAPSSSQGSGGKNTISASSGPAHATSAVSIHVDSRSGSRVVGTVQDDEAVNLNGCDKYWCHLADGRGWISRQYVRFDPPQTMQMAAAPTETQTDAGNGPVQGTVDASTGSPAPANFAGVWKIVPLVVGQEKAADPFNIVFAQSGATVEGTTDEGVRITGVATGNNLGATITRGETKSALNLMMDSTGATVTGAITYEGRTTVVWSGTRTP